MKLRLITLTAACAAMLATISIAHAQEPAEKDAGGTRHRHHKWGNSLEHMTKTLDLTPDQQAKIGPILEQAKPQLKAARQAGVQKKSADRLDRLLADLFEKKKSDEQMLNALCLATLARYPTETEQKLILDAVKAQRDRATAWQGILKALAATEEARAHATELGKRGGK